ncbi:unnamed protein product, partial [Amoebophrya sp. A25]
AEDRQAGDWSGSDRPLRLGNGSWCNINDSEHQPECGDRVPHQETQSNSKSDDLAHEKIAT